MKTIQIKHRYTNAVLFAYDVEDSDSTPLRTAVLAAAHAGRAADDLRAERDVAARRPAHTEDRRLLKESLLAVIDREIASPSADANLAGANLADANLAGANLADAYLAGAYLADANLAGANLADAYLAGAYLADANLAGAYLADANLADANLAGANLAGANLAGANLAGANLAGANLADANLAGANLAGANLADANLADANLAGANLADAYLADANLAGANLADAYLAGANLADAYLADARKKPVSLADHKDPTEPYVRKVPAPADAEAWLSRRRERMAKRAAEYRAANPHVPVVEHLDAKILEAIGKPGCALDMSKWHTCETTHCRAGWAIALAGKAGFALEKKLGSAEYAGRAIYLASTGNAPYFFGSTGAALADIRRCAAEQVAETTEAK